jgi:hypothetical protein
MVKPHSYSISDKNAKFLKSEAKKAGRSVSNTLDRIIDQIRDSGRDKHGRKNFVTLNGLSPICQHGSIDPKDNMCRDCYQIVN